MFERTLIQQTYLQERKHLWCSCGFSLQDSAFVDKVLEEISVRHVLACGVRNLHLVP